MGLPGSMGLCFVIFTHINLPIPSLQDDVFETPAKKASAVDLVRWLMRATMRGRVGKIQKASPRMNVMSMCVECLQCSHGMGVVGWQEFQPQPARRLRSKSSPGPKSCIHGLFSIYSLLEGRIHFNMYISKPIGFDIFTYIYIDK